MRAMAIIKTAAAPIAIPAIAPPERCVPPDPDSFEPVDVELDPVDVEVGLEPAEVDGVYSAGNSSPGESWNFTSARAAFCASSVMVSFGLITPTM